MNKPSEQILEEAKNYLADQFRESSDSSWLEGWACGFTDPQAGVNIAATLSNFEAREELLDFIRELKDGLHDEPLKSKKPGYYRKGTKAYLARHRIAAMLNSGATQTEIATELGIHVTTIHKFIRKHFSVNYSFTP